MCVGIGIKVKSMARKMSFANVVFIGLANDYFGYFVAKEAFLPEYAKDWKYEKSASPFADRAEDFLLSEYAKGLKALAVPEVEDARKRLAGLQEP
jgi:hypothetical protein